MLLIGIKIEMSMVLHISPMTCLMILPPLKGMVVGIQ